MSRVAINLFKINIYWYSIFILLGIIVAYFLITKESKKHNIDKNIINDMIFYGIIFGILGARLYYVIFNYEYYINNPSEIFAIWNGGLAIHGGLIFGAIFVYIYSKKKKINFIRILDIIAPAIMIAQAFGRWGNFFNREAHGGLTTLKNLQNMHLPKFIIDGMYIDGRYYYPTFFFESIGCFVGAILIILVRRRKNIKLGISSGIYFIWYGVLRFFIESKRTDSLMFFNFKIAQIISIISIILGTILIICSKKQKKSIEGDKNV